MKRTFLILISVLLVFAFFVSCKIEVNESGGETVLLRFRTEDRDRTLSGLREAIESSRYVWYYTAEKADASPATGTKSEQTKIGADGKIGDQVTEPFSLGLWNFTLYGYKGSKSDNNLVYKGTAAGYLIKADSKSIDVTVEPQKPDGGRGTIKVDGSIKLTANGVDYKATAVTVKKEGSVTETTKSFDNSGTDIEFEDLDVGAYTVTVVYKPETITYAANSVTVNVWNHLTTTISGRLDEKTVYKSFNAADGVATDSTTIDTSSVQTAGVTLGLSPAAALSAETDLSSYTTNIKGKIVKTGSEEARVRVDVYDLGTLGGGGTVAFTVENGESAVAAIDLTLENARIESGVVIVTTYISKGLSDVKLYHSNNQMDEEAKSTENEVTENNNWFYDAATGKLVFATSSFSPFHVTTAMNVYDEDSNTSYKLEKKGEETEYKLYDASGTEVTPAGGNLVLLDCSLSNVVPDTLSSAGWTVVHNRCSHTGEDCHEENAFFSGGMGTKVEPYLIADKTQFQKITDMYGKYAYYRIADGYTETDLGNWTPVYLHGSFDGNEAAFTNVTSAIFMKVGYYDPSTGFVKENITLKNFSAEMNVETSGHAVVRVISNSGTTRFENITVTGSIFGQWHVASFYNYGTAQAGGEGASYRVDFVKCRSTATLVSPSGNTGGFIGHGYEGSGNTLTLNFDTESVYEGAVYTPLGTGRAYMVMCSNYGGPKVKIGGTEYTGYDGAWNNYSSANNRQIKKAEPKETAGGYSVDVEENASKIIVYVNAQLTAYDGDGNKIPNLQGITLALERRELEDATSNTVLLKKVTSATIDNNAGEYGYKLSDDGAMTVHVPGAHNYLDGTLSLTVVQYDSGGRVLASGTLKVFTITK